MADVQTGKGGLRPLRMSHDQLVEFADFEEQYIGRYIQLADAKAGVSFAVVAGVLAYLVSAEGFVKLLRMQCDPWLGAAAWLNVLLLSTSASLSFLVIRPRLKTSGDGIVFWGAISKYAQSRDFVRRVRSTNRSQFAAQRLSHCYDIAAACADKYRMLSIAMAVGATGIVTTFFLLIFS